MKENYFKKIIYFLIIMFVGVLTVNAADLTVTTYKDMITANFSGELGASAFWINTSNNYDVGSKSFAKSGGLMKSNTGTVSVKNGTYYIWATSTNTVRYGPKTVTINDSCKNESKTNKTGSFTLERCFIKTESSTKMESQATTFSCKSGYTADGNVTIKENTCNGMSLNGMTQRYCKVVYNINCVKGDGSSGGESNVAAATLSALSVSEGSLSPSFKSGTKSYTVNVGASVSSIKVNATASSGNSLVSGYGSRTVKLSYGSNKVKVKVKNSAGKTTTYTITVKRADNRSTVNTLSNLKVSHGTLSPAFSSGTNNYTVNVGNEVSSITIDATLTDSKSKFASGYGPSTVSLQLGVNKIYVKVVSEKGVTNVYNITVNRETIPSECTTNTDDLALLKDIRLYVDMDGVEIDQIESFQSKVFVYTDIEVPYKVSNLSIDASTVDEADKEHIKIEGNTDLEVNVPTEVKVTVTSNKCPNYSNVYTLNVTRQPEKVLSDNAQLENMTIAGYDDFKFQPNVSEYKIVIKKSDKTLDIDTTPVDDGTKCTIEGNKDLKYGSEIKVKCTSEDGENTEIYTITVDDVEEGPNVFLIVLLVIIIICILIYLVLRLLGYKIYFNTAMIGSFFRGMGEKAKNTFDK